jgi:hypothetical protein
LAHGVYNAVVLANPWFNETGDRRVRPGELVALDTDAIGCNGFYADFSRTFLYGDAKPTAYQKMLYRLSHDQIHCNAELVIGHRVSGNCRESRGLLWNGAFDT